MRYADKSYEVRILRFMKVNEPLNQRDRQKQVDALAREGWRVVAASTVGEYGEHSDVFFEREVTSTAPAPIEAGSFEAPTKG